MALKIKRKIIVENIEDENGKVIGQLKFDPKDERIMKKLSDIIKDLTDKVDKINNIGETHEISNKELNNLEEFNSFKNNIEKISAKADLEYEGLKGIIDKLSEIFGQETMMAITGGSVSIENILPLIEFITPYIKEYRENLTGKYLNNAKNSSVFE